MNADSSGNGNTAISTSGTITEGFSGPISSEGSSSKAVYVDNVSLPTPSYWQFDGDGTTLDVVNTFSIEAWIKKTRNGVTEAIMAKVATDGPQLGITAANRLQLKQSNASAIVDSTVTIADTNWHHVVATKSGATSKLYVDRTDVTGTVTDFTFTNTTGDWFMGCAGGDVNWQADMYMAEVAIYSTALSADRVMAHFNAGLELFATPPHRPIRSRGTSW